MSILAEFDEIRAGLSAPGAPFEFERRHIKGADMQVYKNLPPNLTHIIIEAYESFGDRTYIVRNDERWTYADFMPRAAGFAKILRERYGAGPGMRVAIAMRNSSAWMLGYLATLLSGAVVVLINSRGTPEEMGNALDDTDCAVLLADQRRADALAGRFDGTILTAGDGLDFRDAQGGSLAIEPAPIMPSDAVWEDAAAILFTSGTTGRAKGAVLDHIGIATFLYGLRHNGMTHLVHAARKLGVTPEELIAATPQYSSIATSPFFHMSGSTNMVLGGAWNGAKVVIMDRWNPSAALKLVAQERLTVMQGPPSIFWDLIACPDFAEADISSITNVFTAGQGVASNLRDAMIKAFPNTGGGGGFGMTETNGAICTATGDEYLFRPSAAGRVSPGTEVRVVDEAGRELPLGEAGEIQVRSPLVMKGYWNNPEANAAAFSDGWFRTGDVGFLDAERYITIIDRKKDMIISKGENIYSAEIERVFHQVPGLKEVAAFGVPDARLGERLILSVMPHDGVTLDTEELMAFARANLADYKVPTEILIRTEPFPRNALSKIDKVALRKTYRSKSTAEE